MNRKSTEERAQILTLLVEGNSLRSTTRISGASINTVTKLLIEAGKACAWYQDRVFRSLTCKRIQCDEIWSFCYAKEKNVPEDKKGEFGYGDVWTWVGIDADTKLVASWMVGRRTTEAARAFMADLASRLASRTQLITDGNRAYLQAVEDAFGCEIDYAMLQKRYGDNTGEGKYSPGLVIGTEKQKIMGNPDDHHVSTSFVERQNLTMRMSVRRFTRSTNAFSKKVENHAHMIALHFMAYNFIRLHKTLRTTPAMAAGVVDTLWTMEDVVQMMDEYAGQKSN